MAVRIITAKRVRMYAEQYPDAHEWLDAWCEQVAQADWRSIVDVRRMYPHADAVIVRSENIATVFNVRGNRYRLITAIHYNMGKVFVMKFMTHAEYSKGLWKNQL